MFLPATQLPITDHDVHQGRDPSDARALRDGWALSTHKMYQLFGSLQTQILPGWPINIAKKSFGERLGKSRQRAQSQASRKYSDIRLTTIEKDEALIQWVTLYSYNYYVLLEQMTLPAL
ncbi:unnamed protein product [Allacma fusca]|uniref:Uncharacterized protein n=1 Tax=Allacma fusca TaxID=39272 RepID=A0A8J2PEI4_9HEXA|nr:unnamed protein product [Allacma fusca]